MNIHPPVGLLELRLFGSHAAGRQDEFSDIDILARFRPGFRPSQAAIQEFVRQVAVPDVDCTVISEERLTETISSGSLFAWHLYLESKPIWTSQDHEVFNLQCPSYYSKFEEDAQNFGDLLRGILFQINSTAFELHFEAGLAYLAMRNIAMCASLALTNSPDFTRNAPYSPALHALRPLLIPIDLYKKMLEARLWSQRCVGIPPKITPEELVAAIETALNWTGELNMIYRRECTSIA